MRTPSVGRKPSEDQRRKGAKAGYLKKTRMEKSGNSRLSPH